MAIIYSYPTVAPTRTDLILGTDVSVKGKPTKNFTVQSIIDLVTVATGDLQTVLDLGFVAVGKDIDLTNNTFKGAGFQTQDTQTPANVLVNITGQVGTGFTDFTSTRITGTLQTPAQTNITSLGILTDLKVGNANNIINKIVGDTVALNGPMASPGLNTNLVTEKAIVKYITSQPFPENLFKTLQSGNKAYDSSLAGNPGFNIDMGVTGTTNGNILFGDNKGIKMGDFGVTYPFRIGYGFDSSTTNAAYIENATVTRKLAIESDILDLTSFTGTANYLTATKYTAVNDPGVLLYYNNVKTFETILGGATVTGNLNVTLLATTGNIDNNGYYQDSSNSKGTDGQVLTSTGTGTGTAWVDQLVKYTWKLQTPTAGSTPITIPTNTTVKFLNGDNISIAGGVLAGSPPEIGLTFNATGLAKGTGVNTQVTYWTGTDTVGGSGTFRWVGGSGQATSGLSVDTQIRSAKYIGATVIGGTLTNTTATWEGSVMSGLTSVATVPNATANNPNGFFGPLRTNASSTNYASGVADKAVQLTVQGDISTVDDVISYPTTSGTVEAQGAVSTTVVFETSVGKNLSIIYPVQGQVVSGTGITVGTKVASIAGATMVLDTITSATLVAGASLSFTASVLDIYTSGGNVRMPSFIPSTVATSKYLTNLPTPTSVAINANDTLLAGMAKLQGQISALPAGLSYEGVWNAATDSPALSGTTPANGVFYIVNVAGNTNLSGITDWLVGDWAVYLSNGAATDGWQKIDQTSDISGTGAANKIAKWTGPNTLSTGLISDDAAVVTIGATGTGNFLVEGATTLGGSATTNTLISGDLRINKELNLVEGLGAFDGTNFIYGPAVGGIKPVLTSGGSATTPPTWAIPTVGTVTSVGLTETGDALTITNSPITTSGNINIAGAGAADQYINGQLNLVDFPDLDNYVSWTIEADDANTEAITSGAVVDFVGVGNVSTAWDATTNELRISASENPGSGTALTLPVWETGGTTLGDSMVSQNAATGTILTVAGSATFTNDVTIDNSSPELYLTPDSAKYSWMIAAQENVDQHFEITPSTAVGGTTFNAPALKINGANSAATFAGSVSATGVIFANRTLEVLGQNLTHGASRIKICQENTTKSQVRYYGADASTKGILEFVSTTSDGSASFTPLTLNADGSATFTGSITTTSTSGVISPLGVFSTAALDTIVLRVVKTGNVGYNFTFPTTTSIRFGPDTGSDKLFQIKNSGAGVFNVEIDGDLTVDGTINNGGGGIFNGDQAIVTAGYNNTFTLTRATTGTLIFDVWFTSETGTASSVAKKYTVAHSYNKTPVYNKIIDTGPGTGNSNTNDFLVQFTNSNTGATGTSMLCIIKAEGAAQNISYTVQVGHDNANALTFTPNS